MHGHTQGHRIITHIEFFFWVLIAILPVTQTPTEPVKFAVLVEPEQAALGNITDEGDLFDRQPGFAGNFRIVKSGCFALFQPSFMIEIANRITAACLLVEAEIENQLTIGVDHLL